MVSIRPTPDQLNSAYQKLIANEPDAPSQIIELTLDPLIAALEHKFPDPSHKDLIIDTVTDSLFRFVQHPEAFQPERGTLWNYLYMDAFGDLRNAWNKEQRRISHQIPFDPVAHDRPDGNNDVEAAIMRKLVPEGVPEGLEATSVLAQIRQEIPDESDWQVISLMASGERKTQAFAHELGIEHLPPAEQRRIVKQTKDRLRLRLKRWGVKINE